MAETYPTTAIIVENHVNSFGDPWYTPETVARASWYGVGGIPDVRVDGKYSVIGASNCNSAFAAYQTKYLTRMQETGGVAPVDIQGIYTVIGDAGSFEVTFTLVDPVALGTTQGSMWLYEDGVVYNGITYNMVTRVLRTEPVTLTNVGDHVTVTKTFNLDPSWNPANLHAVAVLQQTSGQKTIWQAGRLTFLTDFSLNMPAKVASVPQGNGPALFEGTIKNEGTSADVFSLSFDSAFGWPAEFQLEGDPAWYTAGTVPLPSQGTIGVTLRVTTDNAKRIGTGSFLIHSANSGRTSPTSLRVFNRSYAIFLVDDDANAPYELPYITCLNHLGYLYEDWDVYFDHAGATPAASNLFGFDAVIWQTGYSSGTVLTAGDIANLEAYLDWGGGLYLNSMDFLGSQSGPNTFTTDYLGVASWTNNTKCHTATGVSGDPISDGLVLPLTFESEGLNHADTVNPTATAATIFWSELNTSSAIRNELAGEGARVAFLTFPHNTISASAPAPNNADTVMQRILVWLTRASDTTGLPEFQASQALRAAPNPFTGSTEIRFAISPASAGSPLRLQVVDPAGRLVRTLTPATATPGPQRINWDGRDDAGRPVPSGIYFVRMRNADGDHGTRVVLTR